LRPPGTPTPRIARGFDRLAPVYDGLACLALAGRIHASQRALLQRLPGIRRALVVGGGTGRFLAELLEAQRDAHAVSIDASAAMTRRTRERLAARGLTDRASLRVGGLECLATDERFDLVATHFFLDLFEESELRAVVKRLDTALAPGGLWLFSDLAVVGSGIPRLTRRLVVGSLYAFFRVACGIGARRLPDFNRLFEGVGLEREIHEASALGLLQAALYRKPLDGG
jgi:ubiquinone/menaquinone biosynthesis C-methylase UbiE